MCYVNDLKADNFDANTVYAVLDNHKYGDYKAYVYKSTNKGQTWKSISSNLPEKSHSWRIVQDHIKKNLLFLGTEFGIYFSVNAGVPKESPTNMFCKLLENVICIGHEPRSFPVQDTGLQPTPLHPVACVRTNVPCRIHRG